MRYLWIKLGGTDDGWSNEESFESNEKFSGELAHRKVKSLGWKLGILEILEKLRNFCSRKAIK